MSTGLSWTEQRGAVRDLAALLAFRRSGLTTGSRQRLRWAGALVLLLTVAVLVGPAYLAGPVPREYGGRMLALLPSLCLGFLGLSVLSAVASAGGREVVPRDQAVAFPVSTTADHLGALLLAPLNIAWALQVWTLLAVTAYALGPPLLPVYVLPVVGWVLLATALAQAVGWVVEGVRRGPHGTTVFRLLLAGVLAAGVALVVSGHVTAVLDRSPTRFVMLGVLAGASGDVWGLVWRVALLLLAAGASVVLGSLPARWALSRPMREELRLEGGQHRPRAAPRSALLLLVRLDRASVWRSVPLRRGVGVLAVMPGLVALAGAMEWRTLTILPGLVASGGALLFGVNAWCLDARGALWRDSLPVSARTVFAARAYVLLELLLGAAVVTLVLGAVRAGVPTPGELAAVVLGTVVVAVQVVGGALRWSVARPYAVDLRSARATPAPPVVMVGYSARLALVTTVTGLLYSSLALLGSVTLVALVALAMVLWSGWRLERTAQRWVDPVERSRVVATVAG